MKLGRLRVNVVSDGTWRLDGGILFGQVPKALWQKQVKADGRNRVRLGLNCLVIQSPQGNVLVEAGVGKKCDERRKENYALNTGKLVSGLRTLGLKTTDVQYVTFSHLHFDHAGGATKYNRKREAVPTFPKARYLVQESCWNDATHTNERSRAAYESLDYLPLQEREQLDLINGDKEIVNGVWIKETGGHCRGHQMVVVNGASRTVAFVGDLVPTPYHISLPYITAGDQFPEETLEKKRQILKQAEEEQWILVFSHGYDVHAGMLERHNGRLSVKPVDLSKPDP
ncbi:MAG: MBL fold metallo-hydrolase [Dehalococcoidia bacterium]|nr:MBL fold metallo-hydrolase [Dehalococcoidia bacterium]